MTGRTDLDLDATRSKLERELNSLRAASDSSSDDRKPVTLDQSSVGRLSRMDAMQVQAMARAVEGRRRQRLQQIVAALKRMTEGEFGICEVCGEDIPAARLDIDPTASRCVECAGRA